MICGEKVEQYKSVLLGKRFRFKREIKNKHGRGFEKYAFPPPFRKCREFVKNEVTHGI